MSENDTVYLVRVHGRGGQGAVTAAQLIVNAFDGPGICMPTFGAERMGSPVAAFARCSKNAKLVRTNGAVYSPQYSCVLDDSLLSDVNCAAGVPPGGFLIINTCHTVEEIKKIVKRDDVNYALIDATSIALKFLGRNITNTIILGGFVRVASQVITMAQLGNAITGLFHAKVAQSNLDALKAAESATVLYPTSAKLDFNADFKKQWSHVELGLLGSEELDLAGVWYTKNIDGGSARVNTGSWGVSVAEFHAEYCINCHNCVFICPDFCIKRQEKDGKWQVIGVDDFHCKGCQNCTEVCPGKKDKDTGEVHKALTMKVKC